MSGRVLVNGVADGPVPALDRGLAYGDGLFETIRVLQGSAPLWDRHVARLRDGCARLHLPVPGGALLAREMREVVQELPDAVAKIIVTRGVGTRGYGIALPVQATRIVAGFATPGVRADWYAQGITVRCCALRLAAQPRLAGLKHLNRLEQVLARAEWSDPGVAEGLLFDCNEQLVSATAANVFVAVGGRLLTPPVENCGVAGVLRGALLEALPGAEVQPIARNELMRSDEAFVVSSVRGVLPIRSIDGHGLAPGPHARAAQRFWRALGFPGGAP